MGQDRDCLRGTEEGEGLPCGLGWGSVSLPCWKSALWHLARCVGARLHVPTRVPSWVGSHFSAPNPHASTPFHNLKGLPFKGFQPWA